MSERIKNKIGAEFGFPKENSGLDVFNNINGKSMAKELVNDNAPTVIAAGTLAALTACSTADGPDFVNNLQEAWNDLPPTIKENWHGIVGGAIVGGIHEYIDSKKKGQFAIVEGQPVPVKTGSNIGEYTVSVTSAAAIGGLGQHLTKPFINVDLDRITLVVGVPSIYLLYKKVYRSTKNPLSKEEEKYYREQITGAGSEQNK
jgi:hypothetical protein